MIHQLIFSKLLGEIDYGAMGDFSPAGCVRGGLARVALHVKKAGGAFGGQRNLKNRGR